MNSKLILAAACAAALLPLSAKVNVAPVFSNGMVLQRNMDLPVWGTADPGEEVSVSFAGKTVKTTAGKDGKWMLKLAPMKESAENRKLEIKGKNNAITVSDVLVGEVWLCSGQSNMELPLWGGNARFRHYNGNAVAAKSNYPLIRFVRMVPYGWSPAPRTDFKMEWKAVKPDNISAFTAAGFFFGRELFEKLHIPVGLISAHWGGTRIEPWTPPEGFDSVPELASIRKTVRTRMPGTPEYKAATEKTVKDYSLWLEQYRRDIASNRLPKAPPAYNSDLVYPAQGTHQQPTVLYNRMIYPFVPFAFRGAIWYQGCSNLGDGAIYAKKMQALFNGWKKVFRNPAMKFYFVQLAPFTYGGDPTRLPVIWEAQQAFADANPGAVGMAVITDAGNLHDIHPSDKETVGKRLALLALKRDYGMKDLKADSPVFASAKIEGSKMILSFRNVESWKLIKGTEPKNFELGDLYGNFVPAKAEFSKDKIILSSDKIKEPKRVRFMWKQTCEGNFASEAGLLPGAFRYSSVKDGELFKDLEKNNELVYVCDMLGARGRTPSYTTNRAAELKGRKFKRITYALEIIGNDGKMQTVTVSMDAFTDDVNLIGVPVPGKKFFQQRVKNMFIASNVPGLAVGAFPEGNIEFWPHNYGTTNRKNIPGASAQTYDFGDEITNPEQGYGSMQVHNFLKKQTVFAYNQYHAGRNADIGIGNGPGNNTDWTFAKSGSRLRKAVMRIYISK